MGIYVIVENDIVTNRTFADSPMAANWIKSDEAQIGYLYVDGVFVPPPEPQQEIPQSITALQGLLAIDHFGLAAAYESWAQAPDRTFAQRAFINKAQTWARTDSTLLAAAESFGLTDTQVDAMFVMGAIL